MIAVTCSGRSSGRAPSRFAATAVACGAANDVPSGGRNSSVAHGVYPWSAHAGALAGQRARERREDVLARGRDVVVDGVAVRERRRRAAPRQRAHPEHVRERRRVAREAPRRPGRLVRVADGGDDDGAVLHRVRDRLLLEPRVRVAARVARVAEAAEADVDDPRAVVDGPADRTRLRLDRDRPARVRRPWRRRAPRTGRGRRCPTSLSSCAAMIPATIVPWPRVSWAVPPTKLLRQRRPARARSGWPRSIPESITATRTGASGGGVSQASYARFATAYHCFGASGSVGTNETRRTRSGSTHATPGDRRAAAPGARRRTAHGAARGWSARAPVARSIAAATDAGIGARAEPDGRPARRGPAPGRRARQRRRAPRARARRLTRRPGPSAAGRRGRRRRAGRPSSRSGGA